MKAITKKTILILILAINVNCMFASEWVSIVRLDGLWKFSVGDDMNWSKTNFDDKSWDKINVPGKWERYYEGYNGFGWYRNTFDAKSVPDKGAISLFLGQIDDVDEVYLNGVKIGQTGSFFPNYKSAYNIERKYNIPNGLLMKTNNVLAIRVYDEGYDGGIVSGKIGIFYDNDSQLASVDLSGTWKFSIYRQTGMLEKNFNDKNWNEIQVPATWESQGYPNHDGTAWYRKEFKIPSTLMNEKLFLVLGQIDDYDKVYLNGSMIARTENLTDYSRFNKSRAHLLYRVYELPKSKLAIENVVVIEVADNYGVGGIYDGPVGIMTSKNAKIILERNKQDYWNNPVQSFIEFLLSW